MTNKEAAQVLQEEVNGVPEDLNDEQTERFQEAVRIATQALNTMPFMQDMSDTIDRLRADNEVILRRLKHLLESDYISQFDQVDPNTQEYIRNIREADWKVMYLCDQEKPCKERCEKYHHCKRTSDISHAKNFRFVPNGIYPFIFEEKEAEHE